MRRTYFILVLLLLIGLFCIPASAADASANTGFYATVAADGSCQVTVTATVHLQQPLPELSFPIPAEATDVTLNGARVFPGKNGSVRNVDLSGILGKMAGDATVNISYRLPSVLSSDEKTGELTMTLPLLSGFSYPTEKMQFSVTLPGNVPGKPAFSSGYYQSTIEQSISYSISGAVISGSATASLKDHETLEMTLPVSRELFPSAFSAGPRFQPKVSWIVIVAALAVLYYLIFLRFWTSPLIRASGQVQEDCGAGQMGSILHLSGGDLSLMILQWAQLGYVTIRCGQNVRIRRLMSMGNERSDLEQRAFYALFSRSDTVNCSRMSYVTLCKKTAAMAGERKHLLRAGSGSVRIFRALGAITSAVCGGELGLAMGNSAASGVLLAVLFAFLCGAAGWYLQSWADELFLLRQRPVWGYPVVFALWMGAGFLAGQLSLALKTAVLILIFGLMGAFGGRRTQWGVTRFRKALSLRKYLKTVPAEDLQRICRNNPEYFYELAPYALAFGVHRTFAKKLGNLALPPCPYLETKTPHDSMTAETWSSLAQKTLRQMNARRQNLRKEQVFRILESAKK